MSEADDNFLARWTRRKHAVEAAEVTGEASGAVAGNATQPLIKPAEPSPAADAENEESENSKLLPRIEDLTPQSDLSAFLRKGVPDALKKAALRRMWSLDPAIRDYIGPSEYAWDFNNPASIPGFGPIRPATKEMVAAVFGIVQAKAEIAAGGLVEADPPPAPTSVSGEEMRAGPSPAVAAPADASAPPPAAGASTQHSAPPAGSPRDAAEDLTENANRAGSSSGRQDGGVNARIRRHGGAAPKK
jgi:hypothetical protein